MSSVKCSKKKEKTSFGYLTSAPISVNVNQLLWHICSRTSHLTLLHPLLMCTARADGVYTLTDTHAHRRGYEHTHTHTHVQMPDNTHTPLFVFIL